MTESEDRSQLSTVVSTGDLRLSLEAIRDQLAAVATDALRPKHKRQCFCDCGIGDDRNLVPIYKELRAVIEALDALPGGKEATEVDGIVARAAAKVTNLADRRADRVSVPASS